MSHIKGFPEKGELVVCSVVDVKNFGVFVTLDEYDDKEGFIHVRDVASGWVKYIRDFAREGQKIVCKVLNVELSKGHIDLSLKSVNDHQKRVKIQQWKNGNKAEKLIEIISDRLSISIDESYDTFGDELSEAYGTLYSAFEKVAADPEEFRKKYSGEWVETFIEVASENVAVPFVKVDGIFEMKSLGPCGVDDIRNALTAGIEAAGDVEVSITSVGSPRYRIVVTSDNYKKAEDVMKRVSAIVIESFTKVGGEAILRRENR